MVIEVPPNGSLILLLLFVLLLLPRYVLSCAFNVVDLSSSAGYQNLGLLRVKRKKDAFVTKAGTALTDKLQRTPPDADSAEAEVPI